MLTNYSFHELIHSGNTEALKELLTIKNFGSSIISKTKDGTWAGFWHDLSFQAYQADLELEDIKAIHQLIPDILLNRINMEIAIHRAIEGEDVRFLQILLDICVRGSYSWGGALNLLSKLSFDSILDKALFVNNPAIISSILRCPHPDLIDPIWKNYHAKPKLIAEIKASLQEEDASIKYAKWWVFHLKYLIPCANHRINLLKMIQNYDARSALDVYEEATYLLDITGHAGILDALLDSDGIFDRAIDKYRSWLLGTQTYHRWFCVFEKQLIKKIQKTKDLLDYPHLGSPPLLLSLKILLNAYLESSKDYSPIIHELLTVEPILKLEQNWIVDKISREEDIASPILNKILVHEPLLKQYLESTFFLMKKQLMSLNIDTGFIDRFTSAYQSKHSTQEIWLHLHSHLPELKKDLIKLDQSLSTRLELKQLFKNLLHFVATLMTLGYHYRQRRRDYGQCFFKSAIIENQVKRQTEHLVMSQNFSRS